MVSKPSLSSPKDVARSDWRQHSAPQTHREEVPEKGGDILGHQVNQNKRRQRPGSSLDLAKALQPEPPAPALLPTG